MDIIVWIVTGSVVGWLAFAFLGLNAERGLLISMVIGTIGALLGGKILAPMFITAPVDSISVPSIVFAATVAVAVLLAGNLVQNRWNA